MERYTEHSFDVIVIGAGGAGLRAAIEASASGVSVAMICKSMLGKAHTVMAEGGAAAALGNKDHRDSWEIHFRDTMKGGNILVIGEWLRFMLSKLQIVLENLNSGVRFLIERQED